jgi:hypothetical protein
MFRLCVLLVFYSSLHYSCGLLNGKVRLDFYCGGSELKGWVRLTALFNELLAKRLGRLLFPLAILYLISILRARDAVTRIHVPYCFVQGRQIDGTPTRV